MFRSGSTLQYNLVRSLAEKMHLGEGKGWFPWEQLPEMETQFRQWGEDQRFYIIKSHALLPYSAEWQASGLLKICYTYRDVRDIAVSIKRKFKQEGKELYRLLNKSTQNYFELQKIEGAIAQKYEDMMRDLPGEIRRLAQGLGQSPSEKVVLEIANQWSLDNTRKTISKFCRQRQQKKEIHHFLQELNIEKITTKTIQRINPNFTWNNRYPHDSRSILHPDHISSQGGEIGGWKTQLQPDEIQTINARYHSYLVKAGYIEQ